MRRAFTLIAAVLVGCQSRGADRSERPAPRQGAFEAGPAAAALPVSAKVGPLGHGASGPGYARGANAMGPILARVPDVILGLPVIRGDLDRNLLRRSIRGHLNDVRRCYQSALEKKSDVGGRLVVELSIAPSGEVIASTLESSTLNHPGLEGCTLAAVERWKLPLPGGSPVLVSYPFVFAPADPDPLTGRRNVLLSPPVSPPAEEASIRPPTRR